MLRFRCAHLRAYLLVLFRAAFLTALAALFLAAAFFTTSGTLFFAAIFFAGAGLAPEAPPVRKEDQVRPPIGSPVYACAFLTASFATLSTIHSKLSAPTEW